MQPSFTETNKQTYLSWWASVRENNVIMFCGVSRYLLVGQNAFKYDAESCSMFRGLCVKL